MAQPTITTNQDRDSNFFSASYTGDVELNLHRLEIRSELLGWCCCILSQLISTRDEKHEAIIMTNLSPEKPVDSIIVLTNALIGWSMMPTVIHNYQGSCVHVKSQTTLKTQSAFYKQHMHLFL